MLNPIKLRPHFLRNSHSLAVMLVSLIFIAIPLYVLIATMVFLAIPSRIHAAARMQRRK